MPDETHKKDLGVLLKHLAGGNELFTDAELETMSNEIDFCSKTGTIKPASEATKRAVKLMMSGLGDINN